MISFLYSNLLNYIGNIHLLLACIKYTYGYYSIASTFDSFYLIIFALIPLSWIFYKGECIISYIKKKQEDNNYQMGDQPFDHTDVSNLFKNNNIIYNLYSDISTCVYIGSLIIVNNRSQLISNYLLYIAIILLLIYMMDKNLRLNIQFQIFLSIILLSIIYNVIIQI